MVLLNNSFVVLNLVECYAENMAEYSLACKQSVACLLYVVSVRIVVDIVCNLVDAWQRMQNLHVGLSLAKHRVLEYVDILDALIFHKVREAFLLYTCHIQDVGIGNDVLVEVGVLYILMPCSLQ